MADILDKLLRTETGQSQPTADPSVDSHSKYPEIERALQEAELRKRILENEMLAGYNLGDTQDRQQRKEFAYLIFKFVCYYMFFVSLLLFLCGSPGHFHLSDSVIITLLGTTTANVIGILIIVVTYLFNKSRNK